MTLLSQVKKGKIKRPALVLIYGPDGVGKSTFGADAPKPVFLGTEKGTSNLDVARFPTPKTFNDVLKAISELTTDKHDFKTLVIDSLDWLEPLVWDQVCNEAGKTSIEDVGGGYGKGYGLALKLWQEMIKAISLLQDKTDMNIVLIAHSQVKLFQDPYTGNGYDRYQLKLNEKAAALFREYVDCVLFCNYEVFTKNDKGKTRAFGEGARKIFTERRPAFDAKNRLGLKFEIDLSWEEFFNSSEAGSPDDSHNLRQNIKELLAQIPDKDLKDKVVESVTKAGENSVQLAKIQERLRSRLQPSA